MRQSTWGRGFGDFQMTFIKKQLTGGGIMDIITECQFYAAMAQSVERILGKDEVSSSILLSSTT